MHDILTTIGSNPTAYVSLYLSTKASTDDAMKAITYSMDALVPSFRTTNKPLAEIRQH
jgi:hypothetical protein